MKKLYQSERWKRHSSAVRRHNDKRIKGVNNRIKHRNRQKTPFSGPKIRQTAFEENFSILTAPEQFSLIKNPFQMISFMETMHSEFRRGKNIHIDMRGIKGISCEAIAYLLCNIQDPEFNRKKKCTGNLPADPNIADIIKKSGFFSQVRSAARLDSSYQDRIFRRTGKKVEPKFIVKIITFATTLVYGQKTKVGGVYRTLVECMANI